MKIFQRIDKQKRIEEWIEWSPVDIEIRNPGWGEHIPRGQFSPKEQKIIISGKQNQKEIIKSIIHEICHCVNEDKVDDPDIWDREDRCKIVERQWKSVPSQVVWE